MLSLLQPRASLLVEVHPTILTYYLTLHSFNPLSDFRTAFIYIKWPTALFWLSFLLQVHPYGYFSPIYFGLIQSSLRHYAKLPRYPTTRHILLYIMWWYLSNGLIHSYTHHHTLSHKHSFPFFIPCHLAHIFSYAPFQLSPLSIRSYLTVESATPSTLFRLLSWLGLISHDRCTLRSICRYHSHTRYTFI